MRNRLLAAAVVVGVVGVAAGVAFGAPTGRSPAQAIAARFDKLHSARPAAASTLVLPGSKLSVGVATDTTAEATRMLQITSAVRTGSLERDARLVAWYAAAAKAEARRAQEAAAAAARAAAERRARTRRSVPHYAAPSPAAGGGFLSCVRHRESRGSYTAVNGSSGAAGAYQFMPGTWNSTAQHAGRTDLVGVNPAAASPADQDAMANHLVSWQGTSPWSGQGYSC